VLASSKSQDLGLRARRVVSLRRSTLWTKASMPRPQPATIEASKHFGGQRSRSEAKQPTKARMLARKH